MRAFFNEFIERITQIAEELPEMARNLLLTLLGSTPVPLLLLGALVLLVVIILVVDNHRFVVRTYHLRTNKLRKKMTLVFLTDQHAKVYGEDNEKVISRIREIKPDAILVGGDMIVSARATQESRGWKEDMVGLIRRLSAEYPVYYAPGNHEERLKKLKTIPGYQDIYDHYCKDLVRAGARLLNKDTAPLDAAEVCGLEVPMRYYKKIFRKKLSQETMEELLGTGKTSQFTILLAHNPRFFSCYAAWGADLILSGHYHGGMVRIPGIGGVISPDFRLFPYYAGGKYVITREQAAAGKRGKKARPQETDTENGAVMIVSCGMGTHSLPIRFLNPGELSVITIEPENPVSKLAEEPAATEEKLKAAEPVKAEKEPKPAESAPSEEKKAEEPAPIVEEVKAAEPAPAEEEAKAEEPAPAEEEAKAAEPVPVEEEAKAAEEVPAPTPEEPEAAEEAQKAEDEAAAYDLDDEAETDSPKKTRSGKGLLGFLFGRRNQEEPEEEEEPADPDEAIWDWEPLESHPMARRPIRFEEKMPPTEERAAERTQSVKREKPAEQPDERVNAERTSRGERMKSFLLDRDSKDEE